MKQAQAPHRHRAALLWACALLLPTLAHAQSGVPLKDRFLAGSKQTTVDYYSERLEKYYAEVAQGLPELPASTSLPSVVVPPSAAASGGAAALRRVAGAGGRSGDFAEWDEDVEWVEWRFRIETPADRKSVV